MCHVGQAMGRRRGPHAMRRLMLWMMRTHDECHHVVEYVQRALWVYDQSSLHGVWDEGLVAAWMVHPSQRRMY